MENLFLFIVGAICAVIVVIQIILWILRICNPKQQNHKRSAPPSAKFDHCYFENKDRMWLYYNHWEPKQPARALVFICHGICESSIRYARVAKLLNSSGLEVYAMDHRGHGRSDGYRNYINSMEDIVQDICDFVSHIHSSRPELPVFLFGHSMGGMLAIMAAAKLQSLLRGSVFSAPALSVDPSQAKLLGVVRVLQAVLPKLPVSFLDAKSLCHDPQVIEEYENDILNTPGKLKPVPARTGYQLLISTIKAGKLATEIRTPFLLMQGEEDVVCLPEGAESFMAKAVSNDKELKMWTGLYHEIMNEDIGMEVAQYAANWIASRI